MSNSAVIAALRSRRLYRCKIAAKSNDTQLKLKKSDSFGDKQPVRALTLSELLQPLRYPTDTQIFVISIPFNLRMMPNMTHAEKE